jgi:hypothetical protein
MRNVIPEPFKAERALRQHMHSVRRRSRLCHMQDSDPCGSRSPALNIEKMYFLMSEAIGVVDRWQ